MNLDGSYFRNEAIIASQHNCSGYRSMRKYSSCTEDQVKATKVVDQETDLAKEAEKIKAAAKKRADDKAKAAATPVEAVTPTPGV